MTVGYAQCYHCEEYGHWADSCPLLIPPADKAEHERRFTEVMERFYEGKISPHGKRRVIEKENTLWTKRQKELARK